MILYIIKNVDTYCGCEVPAMILREPSDVILVKTCLCMFQLAHVMISTH